jgi:glycolate oxidase FAD binding subunit
MTGGVALIRVEDFAPSVDYRVGCLRATLGGEMLSDEASRSLWRRVRDAELLPAGPEDAIWRVSVKPSAGPAVAAAVDAAGGRLFLDWGGGLAWIAGPASAAMHDAVRAAARAHAGTWTVVRAPESMRAAVDVVPPEAEALAKITRRVKSALDPAGILNPGRLYAGL